MDQVLYLNEDGTPSQSAPFVDDDGFLQSLIRVASCKITYAEVHFLPPLDASQLNRKQLALAAQSAANDVIQLDGHAPELRPLTAATQ